MWIAAVSCVSFTPDNTRISRAWIIFRAGERADLDRFGGLRALVYFETDISRTDTGSVRGEMVIDILEKSVVAGPVQVPT